MSFWLLVKGINCWFTYLYNRSDPGLVLKWRKIQQRMVDSTSNGSENLEGADQFSVCFRRSQDTQINAIAPPSSLCRWTRAKTNAADTGITQPYSLRHGSNLTSVRNVCEAASISLFWPPTNSTNLPKVCFKFSFILIGKSTMPFLKGQSWHVFKSWYTSGDPEQGFQRCFADGFNQSLVLLVAQIKTPY